MRELDKRMDYLRADLDKLVKRVEALEGQKGLPQTEAIPDQALLRVNGCGWHAEIGREVE
jgi:hypothetical protein